MKKHGKIDYICAVLLVASLSWIGTSFIVYASKSLVSITDSTSVNKGVYVYDPKRDDEIASNQSAHTYYLSNLSPAPPELKADAYIVADLLTGSAIVEYNANKSFPIASLSKLMTALSVTELGSGRELVQLLYPLLLESSNDTAEEIAGVFGRSTFLSSMNTLASRIGMNDTNFSDPSGLSGRNVSSPADLLKLAQYLYKNHPDILALTRVREKEYRSGNKFGTWQNGNLFVKRHHKDYIGGKSGYTPEAGGTLIAIFALPITSEQNHSEVGTGEELRPIAVILLGTDSDKGVKYEVAESIIDYITQNVYYK